MATKFDETYEFPDELEAKKAAAEEDKLEIEIEDDTPPEDRNKEPMPKEIVEKLDADELEDYDDNVKEKLKQMAREQVK